VAATAFTPLAFNGAEINCCLMPPAARGQSPAHELCRFLLRTTHFGPRRHSLGKKDLTVQARASTKFRRVRPTPSTPRPDGPSLPGPQRTIRERDMALQSILFKGDPQLAAATTSNAAHCTRDQQKDSGATAAAGGGDRPNGRGSAKRAPDTSDARSLRAPRESEAGQHNKNMRCNVGAMCSDGTELALVFSSKRILVI
jgi:hypothetical protein